MKFAFGPAWLNRWRLPVVVAVLLLVGMPVRPVAAATAEVTQGTAVSSGYARLYAVQPGARNVAAEAPGKIWFTAPDSGGVGLVTVISDTNTSTVRYQVEFYGLGDDSQPYDLAVADGVVWFTLRGMRGIGRLDSTTRELKTYTLPTYGSAPTGIDVAADGIIWIGATNGRLVSFDPDMEAFTEHNFPNELLGQPRIEKLVYQNSRAIWFTLPDADRVVVYNSVSDSFFAVPTGFQQPTGLTIDSLGRPWITSVTAGRVGVYAPNTLTQWEYYSSSSTESAPAGIVAFDRGGLIEVWYGESNTGLVGRLGLARGFSAVRRNTVPLATPAGNPWGVTVASDQHIWLADTANHLLYELTPPYVYQLYSPVMARQ